MFIRTRMAQLFIFREFDGLESEEICEVMAISTLNKLWVMLQKAAARLDDK